MALQLKKYAKIDPHASKKALVMVNSRLQRLNYLIVCLLPLRPAATLLQLLFQFMGVLD
jgi:hypothetical protein